MLRDDIERLWHNYRSISTALNGLDAIAYGIVDTPTLSFLPTISIEPQFGCYNGRCGQDIWQTLVELEMNCGFKTSIEELVVFNVLDKAGWKYHHYCGPSDVFTLDDELLKQAISKDLFYACCIGLHFCNENFNRCFIDLIEKIDKLQPLFFAKLFTSDIKHFIEWINYAKSEKLQAFIVKSFIQKTPINPPMFRKVVSLFKQEMTQLHMLKMFTN